MRKTRNLAMIIFSLGLSMESYGKNNQDAKVGLDKISTDHLMKVTEFYERKMNFDLEEKLKQRMNERKDITPIKKVSSTSPDLEGVSKKVDSPS